MELKIVVVLNYKNINILYIAQFCDRCSSITCEQHKFLQTKKSNFDYDTHSFVPNKISGLRYLSDLLTWLLERWYFVKIMVNSKRYCIHRRSICIVFYIKVLN